jgi:hypothetical protein
MGVSETVLILGAGTAVLAVLFGARLVARVMTAGIAFTGSSRRINATLNGASQRGPDSCQFALAASRRHRQAAEPNVAGGIPSVAELLGAAGSAWPPFWRHQALNPAQARR